MNTKILDNLPNQIITLHSDSELYIADYKDFNRGEVVILSEKPTDVESVHLLNNDEVEIYFNGFKDNAFPLDNGENNEQCECVLFPKKNNEKHWILFIETKYANDKNAFLPEYDYPNQGINQIIETVNYFRGKNIFNSDKTVHAILSFPKITREFNSFILGFNKINEIFREHKIIIRGVNTVKVISKTLINLEEN